MIEFCKNILKNILIVLLAFLIVIALLLSWPADAFGERERAVAALVQREPSLDEVRAAALRHAGLAGHPERAWSRRARLAGLLPVLTLRADRGTGSDRDLSRSSTGTEKLSVGTDEDLGFEVKAVWKLDRLVFDTVEIRAVQTAQRLHRERVQLLTQVTNLYFQRRKLQLAAIWSPQTDRSKVALERLAIDELTAQLDALTGGYVSRTLARRCAPDAPGRAGSAAAQACP